MAKTVTEKTYSEEHPEQDPAEGSREVIDQDLRQESGKDQSKAGQEKADKTHNL